MLQETIKQGRKIECSGMEGKMSKQEEMFGEVSKVYSEQAMEISRGKLKSLDGRAGMFEEYKGSQCMDRVRLVWIKVVRNDVKEIKQIQFLQEYCVAYESWPFTLKPWGATRGGKQKSDMT